VREIKKMKGKEQGHLLRTCVALEAKSSPWLQQAWRLQSYNCKKFISVKSRMSKEMVSSLKPPKRNIALQTCDLNPVRLA
jgi:hypothetical protein